MRIVIPAGHDIRRAKVELYRMSGAKNVANKKFLSWRELNGDAVYEIVFQSVGWTGREKDYIDLPLWVWRRVGSIRNNWLRLQALKLLRPFHPTRNPLGIFS
jgi:hypothetical protein